MHSTVFLCICFGSQTIFFGTTFHYFLSSSSPLFVPPTRVCYSRIHITTLCSTLFPRDPHLTFHNTSPPPSQPFSVSPPPHLYPQYSPTRTTPRIPCFGHPKLSPCPHNPTHPSSGPSSLASPPNLCIPAYLCSASRAGETRDRAERGSKAAKRMSNPLLVAREDGPLMFHVKQVSRNRAGDDGAWCSTCARAVSLRSPSRRRAPTTPMGLSSSRR